MTGRLNPRLLRPAGRLRELALLRTLKADPEILGAVPRRLVSPDGSFVFTITYLGDPTTIVLQHNHLNLSESTTEQYGLNSSAGAIHFRLIHHVLRYSTFLCYSTVIMVNTVLATYPTGLPHTMSYYNDNYFAAGSNSMTAPTCENCSYTVCQCNHVSLLLYRA